MAAYMNTQIPKKQPTKLTVTLKGSSRNKTVELPRMLVGRRACRVPQGKGRINQKESNPARRTQGSRWAGVSYRPTSTAFITVTLLTTAGAAGGSC